jgi:hypothetical protein
METLDANDPATIAAAAAMATALDALRAGYRSLFTALDRFPASHRAEVVAECKAALLPLQMTLALDKPALAALAAEYEAIAMPPNPETLPQRMHVLLGFAIATSHVLAQPGSGERDNLAIAQDDGYRKLLLAIAGDPAPESPAQA